MDPHAPRPLSTLQLIFYYLIHSIPSGNAVDVLEVEGHLDHRHLETAVRAFVRRHPVFSSQVVRLPFGRAGQGRRAALAALPGVSTLASLGLPEDVCWRVPERELPLTLDFTSLERESDLDGLLDANWNTPFDVEAERSIRFFVFELPGRTVLQIITSRLYNDGLSGYIMGSELAEAYTAAEEGRAWGEAIVDVPDRSSRALFLGHLPALQRRRLRLQAYAKLAQNALSPTVALELPDVPRGRGRVLRTEWGVERLERLRKAAKRRGASVHALLTLALTRARGDFNRARGGPEGPFRMLDLVSYRELSKTPIDGLVDTLVAPYSLTLDPTQRDDAVLRSIASQVAELKNGRALGYLYEYELMLGFAGLVPRDRATAHGQRLVGTNLSFSNPGAVGAPVERFGSHPVTDFWGHSQLYPPVKLTVITSAFRGHLRAMSLYDDAVFPDGPGQVVEAFTARLDGLISG